MERKARTASSLGTESDKAYSSGDKVKDEVSNQTYNRYPMSKDVSDGKRKITRSKLRNLCTKSDVTEVSESLSVDDKYPSLKQTDSSQKRKSTRSKRWNTCTTTEDNITSESQPGDVKSPSLKQTYSGQKRKSTRSNKWNTCTATEDKVASKSLFGNHKYPRISKRQETKRTKTDIQMSLLPTPVLQSQFTYNTDPYGISVITPDTAWVHGYDTTALHLVQKNGHVIRTADDLCRHYNVCSMYVTEAGELMYSDYDNKCLKSISPSGEVSVLFSTGEYSPLGICRLMSGYLVVCVYSMFSLRSIRVYSNDGSIIREFEREHVEYAYNITANKVSGDVCVSDLRKLVVFDENGEHRFTYSGPGMSNKFSCTDVCSDRHGHILIADFSNSYVHILDQNGQFIQYLATEENGLGLPIAIDVDDQGCAWVGEWKTKQIKVFKYLQ